MKNKKAFTLIELIAVLVILAILALIVTPLVLNIIKKARVSADKRSIDAYGRSIELAIADYLLDKGEFPTSIEQLTIEYTGDEVVCNHATLNNDSSVYLAECTVGGRSINGYTYGKKEEIPVAYTIGEKITYNGVDYYVIKDSAETESSVTLLKAEPLTVSEVNQYGVGHINRYTSSSQGTANNVNEYGGIAYYSSETCGYNGGGMVESGCTTDYEESEVKYVVDAWAKKKIPQGLQEARLITLEEGISFGYELKQSCATCDARWTKTDLTPSWLDDYYYYTMSKWEDSNSYVYTIGSGNEITKGNGIYDYHALIRPVVVISKSVLN